MSTPAATPLRAKNISTFPSTTRTTTTTSTTSSTTPRARAHTRETNAIHLICEYWEESTGLRCSPGIRAEICERVRVGYTVEQLQYAIDETTMAPRPSWAYCRAILERMANELPY